MCRFVPFPHSDGGHEVSGAVVLLAGEVGLAVRELVELRLEVDVRRVHHDVRVELARREPRPGEVTRQVTAGLHQLTPVHHYNVQ